jgi:threonine/homoserine/homoserine lactone efflux protein
MRFLKISALAFVLGLSGAMMPGPLLVFTVGQVPLAGWRAVPLMMAGHAGLELIVVGLLIVGLVQALRRRWPRAIISLAGGLMLLLMGVGMVVSARGMALHGKAAAQALATWQLVLAGAAISLANPTFPVWWATVGAGGMAQLAPRTAGEYLSFYLGHELSDFAWYGFVGLVLVTGERYLSDRVYGGLALVCGVALVGLAMWFMWTGIGVLRGKVAEPAGASPALRE